MTFLSVLLFKFISNNGHDLVQPCFIAQNEKLIAQNEELTKKISELKDAKVTACAGEKKIIETGSFCYETVFASFF